MAGTSSKAKAQASKSKRGRDDSSFHGSSDDIVEVQPPRPQAKKRKLAKGKEPDHGPRGSPSSSGDEESEGDDGESAPANKVRVDRPSKVAKQKKKAAKAKGGYKPRDISGSSTDGPPARKPVDLASAKGKKYIAAKEKAERRTGRAMDRSVLARDDAYPSGTADDFKRLIPKPHFDDDWTRGDQASLKERARGDRNFKEQCNVTDHAIGLWKTVLRFTGRLATDVIGPGGGLQFQSDSHKGKMEGHAMTQTFCDGLAPIILHPLFNLNTDQVCLALQWAVICRTGDRRRHRLRGCTDDLFLRKLASVMNEHQDGTRAVGELRELAAYKFLVASGKTIEPPAWSQFLGHIEEKAGTSAGGKAPESDDGDNGAWPEGEPYLVNTTDLKVVRSALDRTRHLSMRTFVDTRSNAEAVKTTRDRNDVPDTPLATRAIKDVLLQEMRNKKRTERGGPPEDPKSPRLGLKPPPWYDAGEESETSDESGASSDDESGPHNGLIT